jgi:hypothetical protein
MVIQEDYVCDHFSFIATYSDRRFRYGDVRVLLTYFERHREMTLEDYRGVLKAMTDLMKRIEDL